MAKHKTLEQKIKAEKRRQQSLVNSSPVLNTEKPFSYSFSGTAKQTIVKQVGSYTAEVPNLIQDLRKTIFLSSVIIAFQIIFYFLLQKHTISLPWNLY